MKVYWTTPSPPELSVFPEAQRKRIWQACSEEGLRKRKSWLGLLICGACAAVGSIVGDLSSLGHWGAGIGGGIGGFIYSQLAIRSTLEIVRERFRLPQDIEQ